jgi:tetratricopeptide (TPR) repeat protein
LARLTRHELKKDEFRTTYEEFERFAKEHYKEIASAVGILIVVVGSAAGLKLYLERQEAQAAIQLGAALRTFRAYVGAPTPPGSPGSEIETFPTARERYKKALDRFTEISRKFPRTKAAEIAAYHAGVCQAELGDQAAAIKTLQGASGASDRTIASLAQLALAGELARTGKLEEARKLYQNLADHPTLTVPRATALLEMAEAYRGTQPAQARRIYEGLEKEFGSDPALAQAIRQQMASLPP